MERRIEITSTTLGVAEQRAVLEVLETGPLCKGPRVEALEHAFATFHGARSAIATSSGATALFATLLASGIGPGDEVIVPSFSFFATAAAVLLARAEPVFADIDPETYCLSPAAAEAAITPRTAAIMPVHLYGAPADLPRFARIAEKHGLLLLEDAAQAHGARIGGSCVGSRGTAAFSFYATKNMTTLEGGMVLTEDPELARRIRLVTNHGRAGSGPHELVGSNFRMNELAAAIGLAQLERLPELSRIRRANAAFLSEHLAGVTPPSIASGAEHVFNLYTVRVPPDLGRDELLTALDEQGIGARVYYPRAIHDEPALRGRLAQPPGDLPETVRATREVLSLPVHPRLTPADLERIVESVDRFRGARSARAR